MFFFFPFRDTVIKVKVMNVSYVLCDAILGSLVREYCGGQRSMVD